MVEAAGPPPKVHERFRPPKQGVFHSCIEPTDDASAASRAMPEPRRDGWLLRSPSRQATAAGATSDACRASAQPLLDLGLSREMSHRAPMAFVPLIIRWGAEASSDQLRQCARCTKCGHKGATLQHPGWAGTHIGFQPFPLPAS